MTNLTNVQITLETGGPEGTIIATFGFDHDLSTNEFDQVMTVWMNRFNPKVTVSTDDIIEEGVPATVKAEVSNFQLTENQLRRFLAREYINLKGLSESIEVNYNRLYSFAFSTGTLVEWEVERVKGVFNHIVDCVSNLYTYGDIIDFVQKPFINLSGIAGHVHGNILAESTVNLLTEKLTLDYILGRG